MTYQNDPNINRRPNQPVGQDRSYTGWIVGGLVASAVIIGAFTMMNRTDSTNTASNTGGVGTTTSTTTGSASAPRSTPAPAPTPAR